MNNERGMGQMGGMKPRLWRGKPEPRGRKEWRGEGGDNLMIPWLAIALGRRRLCSVCFAFLASLREISLFSILDLGGGMVCNCQGGLT